MAKRKRTKKKQLSTKHYKKNKDQERTKINLEGHFVNIMMHKILKVVFVVFKYHNITSVDA